ncbi:hypothetical protein RCS94_02935 [Orbaceae bacterium ac157xtp]
MLIAPSSYGALSATSANTIKGSAPWFTGQSGAKKLGFKIGNTTYSESAGNLSTATGAINNFNAGLMLDEFEVTNLTATDFSLTTDYYDADGDASYSTKADTFSMGSVTYDWYENGKDPDVDAPISVTNQTLGCGSSLSLPLTLKITLPNVKVKSRYGNPNESGEMNLVQMYKIGSESGICFAKPNSLHWRNDYGTSGNSTNGGGYTSDFDPSNGFKASASQKFPTTGFPEAEFTLIMVGNPTDYTFTSSDSRVKVGSDGKVTLKRKPVGPVTITATFNSTPPQVHTYIFDPRTVWVVPKPDTEYYSSAKSICGKRVINGQTELKIPSRSQLTNSPLNNLETGGTIISNYYTRAVGGGISGEWGVTNSNTYPNSLWSSGYQDYWTRDEIVPNSSQFVVNLIGGYVGWRFADNSNVYVACLE